jgi:protoporphyrin/coproporphyrin ferrochelatase
MGLKLDLPKNRPDWSRGKIRLVLLNLGGPESQEAVEPFLFNLFSDPEIIKLPLSFLFQKKFARMISRKKGPEARENYARIGGGSNILEFTNKQGQGMIGRLKNEFPGIEYEICMRYWKPYTEEVLKKLISDKPEGIILFTLYPHYSKATTGASLNEWNRLAEKMNINIPTLTIRSWHDQPDYISCWARRIKAKLEEGSGRTKLLFSAHSLPEKFIKRGDPYQDQVIESINLIVKELGDVDWTAAYQSRSGPVKWLEPGTDQMIRQLGAEQYERVVVCPISFVSDHIETLYEIDMLYKDLAMECGIKEFVRCESLNYGEDFLDCLANITREAIEKTQ